MRSLRSLVLALTALLALTAPVMASADEPKPKESPSPSRESTRARETTSPTTGGDEGAGSSGPAGVSVPRVMLESVVPTPRTVPAGSNFTLSYTLVNQSKKTRVNNLKVTLAQGDGAFLPTNGASSAFISGIKPGGSVSRDIVFSTLPSLENRPYPITMTIEYEDASANQYTATETISIPVDQPTRADTSTFTIVPEELNIGDEASVTFSLNNLGKSKIHNARITVAEGQGVAAKEQFIGSVEPGTSSNVELTLTATGEREEPLTAVISFEDATGTVVTMQKQLALMVLPEPQQEGFGPPPGMEEQPEPEPVVQGSDTWLWWVGGGVVLGVVLLIASISLGRRARQRREQSSDLDLLDGTPLVGSDL